MAVKVTYDVTSTPKLIRVKDGITEIDVQIDLYSDSKEDWIASSDLIKFTFPFTVVGGEALTATKSKTPTYFLSPDWRIKPFEGDHELEVVGDLYSQSSPPEDLFITTSGAFTASVLLTRSFDAITTTLTGSGTGGSGGGGSGGTSTAQFAANSRGPQFSWDLGTGDIPLIFDIQYANARVSGIATTVEVYREFDDFVLDWNSGTFVASPSGSEHKCPMTELVANPGIYRKRFDPRDYGQNQNDQLYYVIYRGTVPSGFKDLASPIEVTNSELHRFSLPSGISAGGSGGDLGMTAAFCE